MGTLDKWGEKVNKEELDNFVPKKDLMQTIVDKLTIDFNEETKVVSINVEV